MDIQSAAVTAVAVTASDYALAMASPTMYATYSRPVQIFISAALGTVAVGFLMPKLM